MDETALLQLLALLLQTVLIIMPMHLTSFEYLRLLSLEYCHFSPHFRMMPPQRFFASCMIFYPLDLHLCSDLFDNVPWPGGGGVPQVSPGLEAAISILLCPPTNRVRYMLKKGSVALRLAQGWKVLSMFFFVHKFHTKCDICKSCTLVSCTMYKVATVDLHMLDLC